MKTLERALTKHATDRPCIEASWTIGQRKHKFNTYFGIASVLQSLAYWVIYLLLLSLRDWIMYLAPYWELSDGPQERQVYDTMHLHYYWPHLANNVHTKAKDFQIRAQDTAQTKHWIDFCCCSHQTFKWSSGILSWWDHCHRQKNQFLVIISILFPKLTRVLPTAKTNATKTALISTDNSFRTMRNSLTFLIGSGPSALGRSSMSSEISSDWMTFWWTLVIQGSKLFERYNQKACEGPSIVRLGAKAMRLSIRSSWHWLIVCRNTAQRTWSPISTFLQLIASHYHIWKKHCCLEGSFSRSCFKSCIIGMRVGQVWTSPGRPETSPTSWKVQPATAR